MTRKKTSFLKVKLIIGLALGAVGLVLGTQVLSPTTHPEKNHYHSPTTPTLSPKQGPGESLIGQITSNPSPTPKPIPPPGPDRKVLDGGKQVFQTFNNCGPAALTMALSHYGQYEFLVLVPSDQQTVAVQTLKQRGDEKEAWQQAYQLAESQLHQNPDDYYARFNQVVALHNLGRYKEATLVYEQVADHLPPRMLWYQIEPILSYYQTGQYNKVLIMTQAVFDSQNRAFAELHWLRGKVFQKRGETHQAESEFDLAKRYNQGSYWKVNVNEII